MPTEDKAEGNGTEKRTKDPKDVIEKVRKLVKLTHNDNEEEASAAALQAIRLLEKSEVVMVPKGDLERLTKQVQGATELAKRAKDEKMQNMILGAFGGFMLAKNKLL